LNVPTSNASTSYQPHRSSTEFTAVVKQLFRSKNFLYYVGFSALQVYECTFEKNFLNLFLDALLGSENAVPRGIFIVISFVLPHLLVAAVTPFVQRHGCYRVILWIVLLKLLTHISVVLASQLFTRSDVLPTHTLSGVLASAFLVFARVLTEMTCRLSPLIMANIVDEDAHTHSRLRPMSALVMGVQSFLVKPGQSLAPMLGWWLFAMGKGREGGAAHAGPNPLYTYVIFAPCVCCIVQLLLWLRFDLHGRKLHTIQKSWDQA
jgi:Na+/melibiose symporter-like transporter